jgi:hypothetical protein
MKEGLCCKETGDKADARLGRERKIKNLQRKRIRKQPWRVLLSEPDQKEFRKEIFVCRESTSRPMNLLKKSRPMRTHRCAVYTCGHPRSWDKRLN